MYVQNLGLENKKSNKLLKKSLFPDKRHKFYLKLY